MSLALSQEWRLFLYQGLHQPTTDLHFSILELGVNCSLPGLYLAVLSSQRLLLNIIHMPVMSQKTSSGTNTPFTGKKTLVSSPDNFWLWSPDEGFDLSRPPNPESAPVPSIYVLSVKSATSLSIQQRLHFLLSIFKILR